MSRYETINLESLEGVKPSQVPSSQDGNIKPTLMIPFCIWHNINKGENSYLSFIKQGIVDPKDPSKVVCERYYNDWKLYGTFWAFSRDFIPIPPRSKIISLKNRNAYPYNNSSVSIDFDPYYKASNVTQFVAYVEGVQNTKILYFHTLKDGVFANFEIDPPYKYSGSIIKRPLAVYVMDKAYDDFECVDGSCQPRDRDLGHGHEKISMINCIYNCKGIEHNFSFVKGKKVEQPILSSPILKDDTIPTISVFNKRFGIVFSVTLGVILTLIFKIVKNYL